MPSQYPKPLSILVVEDDAEFRNCIQIALQRTPYEVATAADAATAIELLRGASFDVVLTDMLIGGRDGLEVIAAVRMNQPRARIIAMSGGNTWVRPSHCLAHALAWGAAEPLTKPFSPAQLIAAIENRPIAG